MQEVVKQDMVVVSHVSKRMKGIQALDDVSCAVPEGSATAIIGPSGSGKTTLLRCINHLIPIDSGTIEVGGSLLGYRRKGDLLLEQREREFCRQRAEIGMVFQHFNLFRNRTVLGNVVEAQVRVLGLTRREAEERSRSALSEVGMDGRTDSYPSELSGGQQQRVAIARALALRPKVLLFDEPTSSLDPELVGEVLRVIRDLSGTGITMVIVTHEISFAREACDRIVFMEHGRVVECGLTEDVFGASALSRTQTFVRSAL